MEKNKRIALTTTEFRSTIDKKLDMELWHKRHGHMSTVILQKIFSVGLKLFRKNINKCIVYPCAK